MKAAGRCQRGRAGPGDGDRRPRAGRPLVRDLYYRRRRPGTRLSALAVHTLRPVTAGQGRPERHGDGV